MKSDRISKHVYLAGPITGCSYDGCTDWRKNVATLLNMVGYTCSSPMRGKQFLKDVKSIASTGYSGIADDHAVVKRDKNDVLNCDVLLINLEGASIVSIGSMFELAWGADHNKFCLVVLDENNPHDHCFVKQNASLVVPSLQAAVDYLVDVYNKQF